MVCHHIALLLQPSRLKWPPLQLLLERKPLKVVKPPLLQKPLSRKKRWKLSLKRVKKKLTLTLANPRLKKWLKWLNSIKSSRKLLPKGCNSRKKPQESEWLANSRQTASNYNKVRTLAGHPSDPPTLLTNVNQVLNILVMVAMAAALVAMVVLTEVLATASTAGRAYTALSVPAMVMDLCTRKELNLLNLN